MPRAFGIGKSSPTQKLSWVGAPQMPGYPSGNHGILLDPRDHRLARQYPGDHLYGLE